MLRAACRQPVLILIPGKDSDSLESINYLIKKSRDLWNI
jgi:hypothetical protein